MKAQKEKDETATNAAPPPNTVTTVVAEIVPPVVSAPAAVVAETAVAVIPPSPGGGAVVSLMDQILADSGEKISRGTDVQIPFLTILQANSPQVKETDPKYVEGAKPGMIYNTASGAIYEALITPKNPNPKGLMVLSCGYRKYVVEWVPRNEGGGFVGQHTLESEVVRKGVFVQVEGKKRKKLRSLAGNDLIETAYHHALICNENGEPEWSVIGMSSTQLKASRKWNKFVETATVTSGGRTVPAPEFAVCYLLRTEPQDNNEGDWFGWNISKGDVVTDESFFLAAKNYFKAVKDGLAKVTAPPVDEPDDNDADDTPVSGKVPF